MNVEDKAFQAIMDIILFPAGGKFRVDYSQTKESDVYFLNARDACLMDDDVSTWVFKPEAADEWEQTVLSSVQEVLDCDQEEAREAIEEEKARRTVWVLSLRNLKAESKPYHGFKVPPSGLGETKDKQLEELLEHPSFVSLKAKMQPRKSDGGRLYSSDYEWIFGNIQSSGECLDSYERGLLSLIARELEVEIVARDWQLANKQTLSTIFKERHRLHIQSAKQSNFNPV